MDHPQITFNTEDGLTPILNTSDRPWAEQVTRIEKAAVLEVANHLDVRTVNVDGRDDEGFLVITFEPRSSQKPFPYPTLYVDKRGHVAEATTNHPVYHRSFREMVEDFRSARA